MPIDPFEPPPPHVPAEPLAPSEPVPSPPPAEASSPFVQPPQNEPAAPYDLVGDPSFYEPAHVVGDTLDEVRQPPPLSTPLPPWEPHDVGTTPDGPPALPFDIATAPTPPPGTPIDVPTSPDLPPAEPFDVATTPDPGPMLPFDVMTSPDGPPWEPVDVSITPSSPPWEPVDVVIEQSPEPEVRDHRNEFVQPPTNVPAEPTIQGTIARMRTLDTQLADYLEGILGGRDILDHTGIRGPGGAAFDPGVLARWLRDYRESVGSLNVAEFIAQQTYLHSMNPLVARVFDPFYFLKMLIPGSMGHATTAADVMFVTAEDIIKRRDVAKSELPQDVPGVEDKNEFSETKRYTDGQDMDLAKEEASAAIGLAGPFSKRTRAGGVPIIRFDATKFFVEGSDSGGRSSIRAEFTAGSGARRSVPGVLAASACTDGIIPTAFPRENANGLYLTRTDSPGEDPDGLQDDEAYVPLSFTDLRPTPDGLYKTAYMRPFNLNFSETIAPEYEEDVAFGRTDPVIGYVRTVRSFELSFDMQAFAAEDLSVIHHKLNFLKSLVYPSYSSDALLKSGPVIRLRIGDAVSSGRRGIPGVIRSLSIDFADMLWELRAGSKVPRGASVAVSFLAIHEGPIGLLDGDFGELRLPTLEDGSRPITVTPGNFQGFGEPSRRR